MRRNAALAGLLLIAASSAGAAQTKATVAAGPDFKALMRKTADAWETLDPAKAAPFYAKDPSLAFYDLAPLKYTGWTEYAAGTSQVFAGFSSLKITLNDDLRTHRRGNVAWATVTARAEVTNKDGSKEALDGRWTVIWEKRGSDWPIVHEHFSVPAPLPAPAQKK